MNHDRPGSDVSPPECLWRLPSWLLGHVAGDAYRLTVGAVGSAAARTDYAVLAGLAEFGPTSQAALCRRLGIDRSDMSAVLDRLGERQLAVRTPDPASRRQNTIEITAEGRQSLAGLGALLGQAQDALMAPLSASERDHLIELLQRLVEYHRGYAHDAGRRPPDSRLSRQ